MTSTPPRLSTIGILSDTHGPIGREIRDAFAGCDHIVHAGDVISPQVLPALQAIAPVTAVRGNTDTHGPTAGLPETAVLEVDGVTFYVLHELQRLTLDPAAAGIGIVVHGHTHRPSVDRRDGVLYLNPGSAGCPRGGGVPSVARVRVGGPRPEVEIVHLPPTECPEPVRTR